MPSKKMRSFAEALTVSRIGSPGLCQAVPAERIAPAGFLGVDVVLSLTR